MTAIGTTRLAWGLCALALLLLPTGPGLLLTEGSPAVPFALSFAAVQISTAVVGAMVSARLPGNAVGWILLAMGVGVGLCSTATAWARPAEPGSEPLPGAAYAAWFGGWAFTPVVFGGVVLLVYVFPDGHYLSRRWRWVAFLSMGVVLSATVVDAFTPGRLEDADLDNPFGAPGRLGDFVAAASNVTDTAALPVFALAVAVLVTRFRRSRGIERQQLKWISSALVLVAVSLGLTAGAPGIAGDTLFFLALFSLAAMPVATGIAVLRYRLYDIDVVLNRALVYGSLTAALGGLYVGTILLLQLMLRPFTDGSSLVIALSTLGVAAVFRPVRGRIQRVVDRRFFRRRYDAAVILETFSGHLRHEVDLGDIADQLGLVVAAAVQPGHVSLWLATRDEP